MATFCRPVVRAQLQRLPIRPSSKRCFATTRALREQSEHHARKEPIDVESLLSKPKWSISSLLPPKDDAWSSSETQITSKQLHHLLRLSALPPPASPQEEQKMLQTLSSQLHFVRSIQSIDTSGVEPLRSLRDETDEGEKEAELGMQEMTEALGVEEVKGKWHRRVRRKRDMSNGDMKVEGEWALLGHAERKTGRYFVVEGGKKEG